VTKELAWWERVRALLAAVGAPTVLIPRGVLNAGLRQSSGWGTKWGTKPYIAKPISAKPDFPKTA
jgi:hypothetical protein